MAVEVNREQLAITSIEELKQYAQGEVVTLPPFAPTSPFVSIIPSACNDAMFVSS